jgi:hypothetical protein
VRTARAVRPGELVLLTVTTAGVNVGVQARAFDRDWPAFQDDPHTWRVLVGIDLDVVPRTYDVAISAGRERTIQTLTVTRRVFPTRRLTVDPDLVHPPPEAQQRADREAVQLHEIWDHPAPQRLWASLFVRPVPDPANSAFGYAQVYPPQREPRSPPPKSPTPESRAVAGSRRPTPVRLAASLFHRQHRVIIDHGLGLFSLLFSAPLRDRRQGRRTGHGRGDHRQGRRDRARDRAAPALDGAGQ